DITEKAGVGGKADWTTGVTMADVNGDGFLDIYVSVVTDHKPQLGSYTNTVFFPNGANQLFINNHNATFTEKAAEYGIALKGYNTQGAFFDYDHDGDLDLFQLQHSIHQTDTYGDTSLRRKPAENTGGKFFRNDGNRFTDVTLTTGIYSSPLGYGLGITVTDFNNDGWDDVYIGNDFTESDYYYVNQKNGKFIEEGTRSFGHTSNFSMGNDAADINHDGWIDLFTLDMLPLDEKILKSSMGDEPFDIYAHQRSLGYGYQYARNCLQLNTGRGKYFSEIALYGGVAATDWSWSTLLADFDLDGYTDIFVTNGIKKRLNDLDYIKFISGSAMSKNLPGNRSNDKEILSKQPSGAWHNYLFTGTDSLRFIDKSREAGFTKKNLSHGAAYADFDNDGDLDLVTNNMNETASLFQNMSRENNRNGSNYLTVSVGGYKGNSKAIGARVEATVNGRLYAYEIQATRGFLSSVETRIHVGLGTSTLVDTLRITWPDNTQEVLMNLSVNREIVIEHKDGIPSEYIEPENLLSFNDLTRSSGINFMHIENFSFSDFSRQWFIPHQLSTAGPHAAIADVNGDGLDDIFIGGAKLQPSILYIQASNGSFNVSMQADIESDSACEDVDALFFDADNDHDPDLYVVSGGNEYFGKMDPLKDRLYLNDGKGKFKKSTGIPDLFENKSVVAASDFDLDGDVDLFVGGRADSKYYGKIPQSFLLVNDGHGIFSIGADSIAKGLLRIGMVTDATWVDIDKDKDPDLVVIGEWMPPRIYVNTGGKLQEKTDMQLPSGWYSTVVSFDADRDGDEDLLLGNYGLNSKLTPPSGFPLRMYISDPDQNGSPDQLLAITKNGKYYPFLGKEDLEKQLPYLKKRFLNYSTMAGKTLEEIFGDRLKNAALFEADDFTSVILINDGHGNFLRKPLPISLQWSPVFAFLPGDFNNDGQADFISGGNFFGVNPFEGRYDAALPTVCIGNGKGDFECYPFLQQPLLSGEIRDIRTIQLAGKRQGILLLRNNNRPVLLEINISESKLLH
ncbi:MAG TPA: VCBS repeat-containing protein, partial [Flavitalea sp.]|nr:VCBS repeat-containing protein [Flavitalea sp.]